MIYVTNGYTMYEFTTEKQAFDFINTDVLKHNLSVEQIYTYITRCKECGVNPEVVMLWDGHEQDKDVKSSRVDRGYTDYSEEYLLKEAAKVQYDIRNIEE